MGSKSHDGGIVLLGIWVCVCLLFLLAVLPSCSNSDFLAAVAPLGPNVMSSPDDARFTDPSGQVDLRADLGIGFINRTAFRAIGTYGGYDPSDANSVLPFGQLGVTSALDLEPNSVTPVFAQSTTRAITLGGRKIIELIRENNLEDEVFAFRSYPSGGALTTNLPSLDLLNEKIGFTAAPFGDPQANVPTQGTAEAVTLEIGTDYTYESIIIIDFVEDASAPGGFRIDSSTAEDLGVNITRLRLLSPPNRALALEPLGLDRMTFQLLSALGTPSLTAAGISPVGGGPDPANSVVTVINAVGDVQTIAVAFFGPDSEVVQIASGGSEQLTLSPGFYEYVILLTEDPDSFEVGSNSVTLPAGTQATLSITRAGT